MTEESERVNRGGRSLLEEAIALALRAHAGTLDRSGRPYILHPLHLMLQMDSEEEMMVAVLHDVVEDSDVTLADLRRAGFPEAVVASVALLTHDKGPTPYEQYIEGIKANPTAVKVKLADLRHNMDLLRIAEVSEKDLARLQKYRRAWDRLSAARPPL